jgi:hypothetical protein
MLWVIDAAFLTSWFVLKFVLHKGGYVHILLIAAITVFVVKVLALRKTRFERISSGH